MVINQPRLREGSLGSTEKACFHCTVFSAGWTPKAGQSALLVTLSEERIAGLPPHVLHKGREHPPPQIREGWVHGLKSERGKETSVSGGSWMSGVQRGAPSPEKTSKFTAESPVQGPRHLGGVWEKCQKPGGRGIVSRFSNKGKGDVQKTTALYAHRQPLWSDRWMWVSAACPMPGPTPSTLGEQLYRARPYFYWACNLSEAYRALRAEGKGSPICLRILKSIMRRRV